MIMAAASSFFFNENRYFSQNNDYFILPNIKTITFMLANKTTIIQPILNYEKKKITNF